METLSFVPTQRNSENTSLNGLNTEHLVELYRMFIKRFHLFQSQSQTLFCVTYQFFASTKKDRLLS